MVKRTIIKQIFTECLQNFKYYSRHISVELMFCRGQRQEIKNLINE